MGLFDIFFKKRYQNQVSDINAYLKETSVKINGLIRAAEGNIIVTEKLKEMQKLFEYTVAPPVKEKTVKEITAMYEELRTMFMKPSWDEAQVVNTINKICIEIEELNSLRTK